MGSAHGHGIPSRTIRLWENEAERISAERRWAQRRAGIEVVESVERQIAGHVPLFVGTGDSLAAAATTDPYLAIVADRLAGR